MEQDASAALDTEWETESGEEVIGVINAKLIHKASGSGADADSGLTQTTTFKHTNDWASSKVRPDAARIELVNNTGSSITLTEVVIRGKPVTIQKRGFVHDSLIDYDAIERDGPRPFRFGNHDTVTKGQLEDLGDFWWKYNRTTKHVYSATLTGTQQWLQPGEWYRLKVGQAGTTENIDATVELVSVRIMRRAGEIGETSVEFREIESAWKPDSNAAARFLASGGQTRLYANKLSVVVGSQYYTGNANLYCDGTNDEVEINAAIDSVSGVSGGGIVHLTAGTFVLGLSVNMANNVILEGEGRVTTLKKNGNFNGVQALVAGGAGPFVGIGVRSLRVTRDNADTNSGVSLVHFASSDNMVLRDLWLDNAYGRALQAGGTDVVIDGLSVLGGGTGAAVWIQGCTDLRLSNVLIDGDGGGMIAGMVLYTVPNLNCSNVVIRHIAYTSGAGDADGLKVTGDNMRLSNIVVKDLSQATGGRWMRGIYIDGDGNQLSDIEVDNVDNLGTAANSRGIYIDGADNVMTSFLVHDCSGTGVITDAAATKTMLSGGRSTGNGTNYTDSGSGTIISSFDVT